MSEIRHHALRGSAGLVIAWLLAAGCGGCGADSRPAIGPVLPPPVARAGKSMIYVYWNRPPVNLDWSEVLAERTHVLVDGRIAGDIKSGEYLAIEVDPGRHTLACQSPFAFGIYLPPREGGGADATPGSSHYFELMVAKGAAEFFERRPEAGRDEIASLARQTAAAP